MGKKLHKGEHFAQLMKNKKLQLDKIAIILTKHAKLPLESTLNLEEQVFIVQVLRVVIKKKCSCRHLFG